MNMRLGCVGQVALLWAVLSGTSMAGDRRAPLENLDPAFRGLWLVSASSTDGGETAEVHKPPLEFARVSAKGLTLLTSKTKVEVLRVRDARAENEGRPWCILTLSTGVFWSVAKKPNGLVELIVATIGDARRAVPNREVARMWITVEERSP